jgi:hypothetical protein
VILKKNIEIWRVVVFLFLEAVFFVWDVFAQRKARRMVRDGHKVSDMEKRKAPKFITIGELERRLLTVRPPHRHTSAKYTYT